MTRIFIDITDMENHWNGATGVAVLDRDNLSGTDMAIAFGDHQLVLTLTQIITLYEILDERLNGGPVTKVGEITKRVRSAVDVITDENPVRFKRLWNDLYTREDFARQFADAVKLQGLRFRMTGEAPLSK